MSGSGKTSLRMMSGVLQAMTVSVTEEHCLCLSERIYDRIVSIAARGTGMGRGTTQQGCLAVHSPRKSKCSDDDETNAI